MTELYKKYRPKDLKDVVGQLNAVKILQQKIDDESIPHALLATGPSGVGKTTILRILRKHVYCHPSQFHEMNCADIRGIENIRDIRSQMHLRPLQGKSKVWLIDEAHKLTNDAQNALLKMLEDTPNGIYFFLATTDPNKLIKTVRTRCTEIALKPIGEDDLKILIGTVSDLEGNKVPEDVADKIVENSDGSARKALVLLDSVIKLKSEEEMLEAIQKSTLEPQAIELCRMLLNPRSNWKDIGKLLKDLEGEDAEGLRRMVLGYMRSVLLNSGMSRAGFIIGMFERNFFDSGNAGLALACWETMNSRK